MDRDVLAYSDQRVFSLLFFFFNFVISRIWRKFQKKIAKLVKSTLEKKNCPKLPKIAPKKLISTMALYVDIFSKLSIKRQLLFQIL
jgi:hypothetical protein